MSFTFEASRLLAIAVSCSSASGTQILFQKLFQSFWPTHRQSFWADQISPKHQPSSPSIYWCLLRHQYQISLGPSSWESDQPLWVLWSSDSYADWSGCSPCTMAVDNHCKKPQLSFNRLHAVDRATSCSLRKTGRRAAMARWRLTGKSFACLLYPLIVGLSRRYLRLQELPHVLFRLMCSIEHPQSLWPQRSPTIQTSDLSILPSLAPLLPSLLLFFLASFQASASSIIQHYSCLN